MHPGVPSWHSKKTLAVTTTDALLRIYLSSCLGLNNWQGVYLDLRSLKESGQVQGIWRQYLLIRTGLLCMEFPALCHLGHSPAWKQDFGELPQICCVQQPCGQARGILWVHGECVSVSVQSCSVSVGFKPNRMQGVPQRAHCTSQRTEISVTRPELTLLQGPARDSEQRMDKIHGLGKKKLHTPDYISTDYTLVWQSSIKLCVVLTYSSEL